jgi:cell division protein FtsL
MKKVKKIAIYVVSAIVLLFIGSGIGSSGAKTTLDGEKVTASQLEKKISDDKSKLSGLNDQLAESQTTLVKAGDAKKELSDIQPKIDDAKKQLSDTQSKVGDLQSQLDAKQKQLDSLKGQIAQAADAPKTLPAGNWSVGKDIPAGRYTATPIGEGSNFAVEDNGSYPVNTILGSNGVPSYTFDCSEGQTIQTEAPVKLTPVE